jgi:hypothetical protein
MIELLGLIFGGASRLFQHWLDMQDKQREREHEAVMYDKQITLAERKIDAEKDLRRMDQEAAEVAGEFEALRAAIESQAAEAKAAGGWVLQLSASVRPVLSYWFAAIYTIAKLAGLYLALSSGVALGEAVRACYTEFDGTILASILSFYFADRSLRKK